VRCYHLVFQNQSDRRRFQSPVPGPCDSVKVTEQYQLSHLGVYAVSVSVVCLSLVHSVCVEDYCYSNEPISLKLGLMIGPTILEELMTRSLIWVQDHFSPSLTIAQ